MTTNEENNKKYEGREYMYSAQARAIIDACRTFDFNDFEQWFRTNVAHAVGSSYIVDYITQKAKKEGGK